MEGFKELNFLLFLQHIRQASDSILDSMMLTVTALGEPVITFLLLSFVYWCVDKKAGQRMAFSVTFACWLNQWIKKVFKIERPWVRDSRIRPVEEALANAGGYSMPSGHTTRTVATWGALGFSVYKNKSGDLLEKKKENKLISLGCFILIFLVMFSRNYLGVHTFADVFVAFVIGLIFIVAIDQLLNWVDKADCGYRDIVVVVIGCVLLLLPMLRFGCLSNAGAGYGFLIGWIIERRFVRFNVDYGASYSRRLLRFIPGAFIVFICFTSGTTIFSHIFNPKHAGFYLQFAAAFFIICVYPALIKLWEDASIDKENRVKYKKTVLGIFIICCLVMSAIFVLKVRSHYAEFDGVDEVGVDYSDVQDIENGPEDICVTNDHPVLVIAHRGNSGSAPENTLSSFRSAIDAGADMIELDVQMTSDGVLVVFHDDDISRITGESGHISDYTYDELLTMDAGKWYMDANYDEIPEDVIDYTGEHIPTLAEVLELVDGTSVHIYIELKNISEFEELSEEQRDHFAIDVVDEVEAYGMIDSVLFASFRYEYLEQIENINKDYDPLYISVSGDANSLINDTPADYYGLALDNLQSDTIDILHSYEKPVYIWTVNNRTDMKFILLLGADGIVTNYSEMALDIINNGW